MMVYCAHIDIENKRSEIFCDGEITEIDGFKICEKINMSQSTVCFVSSVKVVKLIYPGGEVEGEEYYRNNDSDILSYKYGNCEFRSFGALIGMQNIKALKRMYDLPITAAMYEYICQFGDPKNVKYTLAYQAKKLFYSDISDELWEERKKLNKHYWDTTTYWDMMVGNKGGVLSDFRAKYIEDVLMYDIRSAYASVLVNDDKFPVGKINKIDCKNNKYKIAKIKKFMRDGVWFKVVFDCKSEDFLRWYDKKSGKTGMEYYNFLTLEMVGELDNLFDFLLNVDFRLYFSSNTGYINKAVRDKLVYLYRKKEELPKESFERYITKTEIEMIYGKGIQYHDFNDIKDIQEHYKGRGSNYLTPEMSNHCIAKVEYDMFRAIYNTESEYYDTDGIKVKNTQESIDYFKSENEKIMLINKKAGYDTDIGTWKFEGKSERMLIFTPKVYIFECNGNITFKAAGVNKEYKERIINSIKGDKIEFLRRNGFETVVIKYKYDCGDFTPCIIHGKVYGDKQWQIKRSQSS